MEKILSYVLFQMNEIFIRSHINLIFVGGDTLKDISYCIKW